MVMQQEPMGSFLSEAIPAGYSAIRDKIRNFPQIPWGRIPQTFRDNQSVGAQVLRGLGQGGALRGALRGALGSIPPELNPASGRRFLTMQPPMPTPMPMPMPLGLGGMARGALGSIPMPTPMPMRMATPVPQPHPINYIPLPAGAAPPNIVEPNIVEPNIVEPNIVEPTLIPRRARYVPPSRIPLRQPMLRQSLSAGGETPTPQEIRNISGGVMDLYLDR